MTAPDLRCPDRSVLTDAIRDLNATCSEVGLRLVACPSPDDPGREAVLGTADPATVRQLTDLLRASMTRTYDTVAALRGAVAAHGVQVPDLSVVAGEIMLGDLTVPDAERLAQVLGAPARDPEAEPVSELADWPQGKEVAARLGHAFREVTGKFIDLAFQPDCSRCGSKPAISTGAVSVGTARLLLEALEYGGQA
ncbi:hypothetical protein ACFVIM_00605 [Streptomyces sp. NPDC057638]|uniref:hypothetical protein n=1 Tax=Streptomyces sp. NPDC057638 TaxID=3346190 RepID=UPI0036D0CC84